MTVMEAIQARYSVRQYADKPISGTPVNFGMRVLILKPLPAGASSQSASLTPNAPIKLSKCSNPFAFSRSCSRYRIMTCSSVREFVKGVPIAALPLNEKLRYV